VSGFLAPPHLSIPMYLRQKESLYGMNMKDPINNRAQSIGAIFSIAMKNISRKILTNEINKKSSEIISAVFSDLKFNTGALLRINLIYDPVTDNYFLPPNRAVSFIGIGFTPADALSEQSLNGGELGSPYIGIINSYRKPQYLWILKNHESIIQIGVPNSKQLHKEALTIENQKIEQQFIKIQYSSSSLNYNDIANFWSNQYELHKTNIKNSAITNRIQYLNKEFGKSQSSIVANYKKYVVLSARLNGNTVFDKILKLVSNLSDIYNSVEGKKQQNIEIEKNRLIDAKRQNDAISKYQSELNTVKSN